MKPSIRVLIVGLLIPTFVALSTANAQTGEEQTPPADTKAEAAPVVDTPKEEDAPVEAPVEPARPATPEESAPPLEARYEAQPVETQVEKAPAEALPAPEDFSVGVAWNEKQEDHDQRYLWKFLISGYLRTAYSSVQDDPKSDLHGQNDGFVLLNARIGFAGTMRKTLGFKLQLDGAVDRLITDAVRPVSEVDTRVRDAKIWWEATRWTRLTVGQFKPEFDVEELYTRDQLLFVDRSVGSRGVRNVEGPNVEGLSRDREAGAMLGMRPYHFGENADEDGIGVAYSLAITNGNSSNLSLNANQSYATYGRGELWYGKMVRVGGAAFMNTRTESPEAADNTNKDEFGFSADATFFYAGATLVGSFTSLESTPSDIDKESTLTSTAYQVQAAYEEPFFGFQPTFRYAFYDPETTEIADPVMDGKALTYYTLGVNYNPRYPIRVMVDYTITVEEEARSLDNNKLNVLLQAVW